ncbi:DUF5625 family protein [Herbaspirillum seropedicae]|uniref:DUF5625 family protein n=1 Tax=Herbaspirillum seropedicae TaxID=964 RepID=UPI003FCE29E4
MKVKKKLRKLMALIGMVSAAPMPPVLAADAPVSEKIHESRFHMPFPVQKAGEKIDVLVRVEKTDRAYGFYLILVEEKSWPVEKKEDLQRLYYGWMVGDSGKTPYPIKVRLQIDSVDAENEIHINEIVAERSPRYGESVNEGRQTWRAETLYLSRLPAGVYRVRLENLAAVPLIDFATLFAFEKDNRKY